MRCLHPAIAALLSFLGLAACNGGSSDTARQADSVVLPDPSWRPLIGVGPFSLALPPELQQVPIQGEDSQVGEYRGPTLVLRSDYGRYGAKPDCGDEPNCTQGKGRAGDRSFKWVRLDYGKSSQSHAFQQIFIARFEGLGFSHDEPVTLSLFAECKTDRDCDLAYRIIETVRFDPTQLPK